MRCLLRSSLALPDPVRGRVGSDGGARGERQPVGGDGLVLPVPAGGAHSASTPCSLVRIRITRSTGAIQILPSPIFPVRAAPAMVSATFSASAVSQRTSTFTLGRRSTVYSAPR